jgi:hypothetical protein
MVKIINIDFQVFAAKKAVSYDLQSNMLSQSCVCQEQNFCYIKDLPVFEMKKWHVCFKWFFDTIAKDLQVLATRCHILILSHI